MEVNAFTPYTSECLILPSLFIEGIELQVGCHFFPNASIWKASLYYILASLLLLKSFLILFVCDLVLHPCPSPPTPETCILFASEITNNVSECGSFSPGTEHTEDPLLGTVLQFTDISVNYFFDNVSPLLPLFSRSGALISWCRPCGQVLHFSSLLSYLPASSLALLPGNFPQLDPQL